MDLGPKNITDLARRKGSDDTDKPVILPGVDVVMKQMCQREYHLFALSETNQLYVAGAHGDWRKKYDKLEPCPSDMLPAEPIKEVKCNGRRIAILTESHKIYITERCREDDAPEQARRDGWIFKHYERPNEDTEKLLNWDIGEAALCYTTEDGKAYEKQNRRRGLFGFKR